MKSFGGLWERLCSFDNLLTAAQNARRGKRNRPDVAQFHFRLEPNLFALQRELLAGTYQPGRYRQFWITEKKARLISAAPYGDRVVHHALCNVLNPLWEPRFIHDSYACRVGKGTHAAANRVAEFLRAGGWVLKMDLRKYFPSLDHEILLGLIARRVRERKVLELVRRIVETSPPQEPADWYFPGDDLFTPFQRKRGIPIGNLTSQFFANVYLNDLDRFAKEVLGCRAYIRYVDDITVFDDDKKRLWDISRRLAEFLIRERLSLHPDKTFVLPVTEGVDHLGYRVYPTHRRLRRDNVWRFLRKMRQMQALYAEDKVTLAEISASVQSWLGHARHADTYGLRKKIFEGNCFIKQHPT